MSEKKGLGRGFAALLPHLSQPVESQGNQTTVVPIEEIHPNPNQPRKVFDDESLSELADSIKEKGILQPLLLRRVSGAYQIVVGERRWRAAMKAGLKHVPILLKDVSDVEAIETALVENLQREDLDPLEEAASFHRLIEEYGYTQEKIAARIGRQRPSVANALRLLRLAEPVKTLVAEGKLSAGHARALIGLPEDKQQRLAHMIIERKLNVRQAENIVNRMRERKSAKASGASTGLYSHVSEELQRRFGTRVRIKGTPNRGKIEIEYFSKEDLMRIVDLLSKPLD